MAVHTCEIIVKESRPDFATEIASALGIHPIAAQVLAARGYDSLNQVRDFLSPTLRSGLPHPQEIFRIEEAGRLIGSIARSGAAIAVCCDFDVDGLTGGSQLIRFFNALGIPAFCFVPDRFIDGYGLSRRLIDEAKARGCSLMITVDFGTKNSVELDYARSLGLESIVIDHHHVGDEKVAADVFINPHQKGCGFAQGILSASGLVWFVISYLKGILPGGEKIDAKELLSLSCLGTICDMVPLQGPNRIIARRGLEALGRSSILGLAQLREVSRVKGEVSCYDVGFLLGPRINAAGRMEHGSLVIDLLTTADESEAVRLARKLEDLNEKRQLTEKAIQAKAEDQIAGLSGLPSAILSFGDDFHLGVVGIVAQRLAEKFRRPAAVAGLDSSSQKGRDSIYKGSVRGVRGFNVVDALSNVRETLIKFGGHQGAGGFAVAAGALREFAIGFVAESQRQLGGEPAPHAVDADCEVRLDDLSFGLVDTFEKFSPFGVGNPAPTLVARGLEVREVRNLKNNHLRVTFAEGNRHLVGMLWRAGNNPLVRQGAKLDVAFKLERNSYEGYVALRANVQGIAAAA